MTHASNPSRPGYPIDTSKLLRPFFEMGPIRPPSEGRDRSLLIRATRNCPWNRCLFCSTYKNSRFEYRPLDEIKQDISIARALADEIKKASWQLGLAGRVSNEVLGAIVTGNPRIYGPDRPDERIRELAVQSLVNVAGWMASGGRTAFLQDANTLIMRVPDLVGVIEHLKESFPAIERVTSYAWSKTASKRSTDELQELHRAGLSRLHIGFESGSAEVLALMQKGVTPEQQVAGGRKVVQSGISLSEYLMPGLGGRRWSEGHALESARALNEISPDFIRLRSLVVRQNSPLHDLWKRGEFQPLTEDEAVREIGLLIENLKCSAHLASDQMCNLLPEVEGRLPEDREKLLGVISDYLSRSPAERLEFCLERRVASFVAVCGGLSEDMENEVESARQAIEAEAPNAAEQVGVALLALKQAFI